LTEEKKDQEAAAERPAGATPGSRCPSLSGLFLSFLRLGAVSFGGPAMVAYILRSSAVSQGATRSLVLSFVGLLASVTIQFARVTPWSVPSAIIAAAALVALLLKVDVLWVVLAGAAVSAVVV
jgi:chromate transport protein ChrA